MTSTDHDPKPLNGPEVEMVEKVDGNTTGDGDESHSVGGVIPFSTTQTFSDKGRRPHRVVYLPRTKSSYREERRSPQDRLAHHAPGGVGLRPPVRGQGA